MTRIAACTCSHAFQDDRYGKQQRVHNMMKESVPQKWRCTVCSSQREAA